MDAESLTSGGMLGGADIASILQSEGPIVTCVLLKANGNEDASLAVSSINDNNSAKENIHENGHDKSSSDSTSPAKKDEPAPTPENNAIATTNNNSIDSKNGSTCSSCVNDSMISEIEIDTTPKKSMVEQVLGGPFTFLGQYEDEGIVLMIRQQADDEAEADESLPINQHKLQPPFHIRENIRGDILIMKVASNNNEDDESDTNNNHEFFQNYTKEAYLKFAARTDIIAPPLPEEEENDEDDEEVDCTQKQTYDKEEEEEDDDDDSQDEEFDPFDTMGEDMDDGEDEEDCQIGMMNLIFGQILKQFREEHGRGPNTQELLDMRQALAEKLGVQLGDTAINDDNDDTEEDETAQNEKRRRNEDDTNNAPTQKRVKFAIEEPNDENDNEAITTKESQSKEESITAAATTTTSTTDENDEIILKEGEAEV